MTTGANVYKIVSALNKDFRALQLHQMFESNHVNRDSLFRLLSLIQFVECAAVDSDMTVIEPQLLPTENCSELSTFVNPMPLFFKVQAQLESRSFVGVPMSCGIGYHWLEMKA